MATPTVALANQAHTHDTHDFGGVTVVEPQDRHLPWLMSSYTQVPEGITRIQDALELGQLTWEVGKRNIRTMDGTPVPDYQAVIRTDTKAVLGVVGRKFEPLQNLDALSPVDALLGESGGSIRAVGPLNGGRRVFVAIDLNRQVTVPGDLTTSVNAWMIVANGHDGSLALSLNVLEHVVRCTNILVALARSATWRIRLIHRPGIEAKYRQAHQAIGQVNGYLDQSNDLKSDLAARHVTDGQARRIISAAFPERKPQEGRDVPLGRPVQFDQAWALWQSSPTIPDDLRNTAWGAVQAVTEYVDHGTDWRGGERGGISDRRMNALALGASRSDGQKSRAIEAALSLPHRKARVASA